MPRLGGYLDEDPPTNLAAHEVQWKGLASSHLAELEATLAQAEDERPLQKFLAEHPHVLVMGVLGITRRAWVLAKPKFGAEYVPDFLIGLIDSLGPGWMLVELESPTMAPLDADDALSGGLYHAVQQIRDNRKWLADNAAYFRSEHGCWGIEAGCAATVLIGRREDRDNLKAANRFRDLRNENIEIMSYDWLVENYQSQSTWYLSLSRTPSP